jgi:alkylation response protein AidB-like acyl-CoA dehydrogenase
LGNLKTRGIIGGDYLVITGQKTWSTWAHIADWCFTLVRTSDTQPGHKGLTYVLVDLKNTPGVTVRPIRQITNDRDFSEIYFDEARVPLRNVIGGIDKGWHATMTTLTNERTLAYFDAPLRHLRILDQVVALARKTNRNGRPAFDDPLIRQKLAQCRISWLLKLYWSEVMQRLSAVALDIEEPYALLMKGSARAADDGHWPYYYLWMKSETIAGGTSEIHRNTLAERILGMPK